MLCVSLNHIVPKPFPPPAFDVLITFRNEATTISVCVHLKLNSQKFPLLFSLLHDGIQST